MALELIQFVRKWCSTISKAYFSRNLLSSQRSETSRSSKRRLHPTTNHCEFYNIFCNVVSKLMNEKNGEDHRCRKGNAEMNFPSINILQHTLFEIQLKLS